MFARKGVFSSVGRATALATVAALAVTAAEPAFAGSADAGKRGVAVSKASDATDFSARRRTVHRYRGNGGAAAAAAFAGIVGTGLAIAAAQNRRAYYDDYYGGPAYYGGPGYYGAPGYYGYGAPDVPGPYYGRGW